MRFPKLGGSRAIARMLAAALIAAGAAGCSDGKRFGDNAVSNPFASRREAANQAAPADAAPLGRVEAQPLGTQSAAPLPPPPGPEPSYPPRDTTGSLAAASSSGEITVTVAPGDTVDAIARRYGVASTAIVQANHLTAAASIQAGQRLIIPRHHSVTRPLAAASSARGGGSHGRSAPGGMHVVAPGETLSSVAHRYGHSRSAIAKANDITPDTKLRIGQQLTIPGAKPTRVAAGNPVHSPPAPVGRHLPAVSAPHSQPPQRVATAEAGAPLAAAEPAAAKTEALTESSSSTGGFRWPVRRSGI